MPDEIPDDPEGRMTFYPCPVCGKETIWFECEGYENGDPSTPYYESGYGPALFQGCECRLTQDQINVFPVPMGMCCVPDDDW